MWPHLVKRQEKKKKKRWEFTASCRVYLRVAGTSIRQPADGIRITPPVQVRADPGALQVSDRNVWLITDTLKHEIWFKCEVVHNETRPQQSSEGRLVPPQLQRLCASSSLCMKLKISFALFWTDCLDPRLVWKCVIYTLFKVEIFTVAAELKELAFVLSEAGLTSFMAPWGRKKNGYQVLWLH